MSRGRLGGGSRTFFERLKHGCDLTDGFSCAMLGQLAEQGHAPDVDPTAVDARACELGFTQACDASKATP